PGQRQVEARELRVAEIEAQHLRVPARVLRELQKDMPRASNAARIEASVAAVDIEPWPAIKGAFAHPGDKIGHEVVSEAVALVDRAPALAGPGLHRHSDAVAQTRRIEPLVLSLRRGGEHKGTAGI